MTGLRRNRINPWVILADFNDISHQWEKVGGRRKNQSKMDGFDRLIDDLRVGDIGFKGQMHTRSNNRAGDDRIVERLDRVLANAEWRNLFPRATCLHGVALGSDHVPIHLKLDRAERRGSKVFKFEDMWLPNPKCFVVIKAGLGERGPTYESGTVQYEDWGMQIRTYQMEFP